MNEHSEKRQVVRPNGVPFLLNMILAGALGAGLSGGIGAGVGIGLLIAAYMLIWLIGRLRDRPTAVHAMLWRTVALLRPLAAILALPFVLALALVAMVAAALWEGLRPFVRLPAPGLPPLLHRMPRFPSHMAAAFFSAKALPTTAVNALLLLTLLSVVAGIDVAFYAALAAVPLILLTLLMVAIDSSREPDGE